MIDGRVKYPSDLALLFQAAAKRFLDIGREEHGAALVVTLSIFFLMYLGCMGVYAISVSVKERIQLQNAVDAAAYSAAVLQSDTFSRIATINRAMAWTYVQMTREQMDYIVYRWLTHTYDHFQEDRNRARSFHSCVGSCWGSRHTHSPEGWYIGSNLRKDCIQLNGFNSPMLVIPVQNELSSALNLGGVVSASSIKTQLDFSDAMQGIGQYDSWNPLAFAGNTAVLSPLAAAVAAEAVETPVPSNLDTAASITRMTDELDGPAGKAVSDADLAALLKVQIILDRLTIAAMNIKSRKLVTEMPSNIEAAVREVVASNVAGVLQDRCTYYLCQNENPLALEEANDPYGLLPGGYFTNLHNIKRDERRFLRFAGYTDWPVNVFKKSSLSLDLSGQCAGGLEQWFVRGNGWRRTDGGVGLQRSYKHWAEGPFKGWHASHSPNPPSCWNTEKLDGSPQTIALHSSWEWFSGKWICFWVPTFSGVKDFHIGWNFLDECSHDGGRSGHNFTEQITALTKALQAVVRYPSYLASALGGLKTNTGDGDTNIPVVDPNVYGGVSTPIESYKDGCFVTMDWLRLGNAGKRETLILPWSGYSRLYADDPHLYNSAYVGERAKPLILKANYSGRAGTISVGVRCRNENVFVRLLGSIQGIFKAFDPDWNGVGVNTHTYVFASAKAGYRDKGATQSKSDYASRAYRIDWDWDAELSRGQDWNLCQSDWDAVFVPVRKAYSSASSAGGVKIWNDGGDDMLVDWVSDIDGWKSLAGTASNDNVSWESIEAPRGVLRGNGHEGILDWRGLSHVMFH